MAMPFANLAEGRGMTRSYYRLFLGEGSKFAARCYNEGFVGVHFGLDQDLTYQLPDDWKSFNKQFISVYLKSHPNAGNRRAGLACATIWMVSKGMKVGDILLSPDGEGNYLVGEIVGPYSYNPQDILPHRRKVRWLSSRVPRASMSESLRNSAGSIGTYATLRPEFTDEIERLIAGSSALPVTQRPAFSSEESASFAFERHLEDFLVRNWEQTELGRTHDLYVDENEEGQRVVGKQIPTDTGRIDILAISKDKRELLVIELKNNRAGDQAVGQVQRYMGYVMEEIAEAHQSVRGLIVATEDDLGIRRALRVANNVEFWRFEITFKLHRDNRKAS